MPGTERHKESILIVEDSSTQAMLLHEILENTGYEVRIAADGTEALGILETAVPDLILSDINMPVMDGFELCRKIKSSPGRYSVPVIFLTALIEPEDIIRGIECGADGYLIKSYDGDYLLTRIGNIISNHREYSSPRNEGIIEYRYSGKEFSISSNPLQILNLLLSTYDSVIQKNLELTAKQREITGINRELEMKIRERERELKIQLQERVAAEKALRGSEKNYRDLIENAPVGMFISTAGGKLKFVNEAFCRLLDYDSADELKDIRPEAMYGIPGTLEKFNEILVSKGEITGFQTDLLSRDGSPRHVILSVERVNGEFSGMILDITERKESEERARQYRRELLTARKRAEQSEKLKDSFLANMSNDILTPLNTLMGLSELISSAELPGKSMEEYIHEINRNGKSILDLVDSTIDVAKHETGEVTINLAACKINQLLLDLYAGYEGPIREKSGGGIELRLKRAAKEEDFTILTEPHRIKQVLSNLLSNALASTASGYIEFGYTLQDTDTDSNGNINLTFYVKDTGAGIPDNQKDMIFDRFRNIESSGDPANHGTGIGLPLSMAYVKLLGGEMWFQSESGQGSTFNFSIPCQVVQHEIRAAVTKAEEVSVPGPREGLEILIAEDSHSNYFLIKTMLSRENCRLTWAKNGREAVKLFRDNPRINLILMDIRMPVMTGFEAISEIRKFDRDVPIIIQTAYAREEDREKILQSDCADYITKPIDSAKLKEMIRRYSNDN